MTKLLLWLALCLTFGNLFAQNQKIDSLKSQLKRTNSEQKINILNQLAFQYRLYSLDSSLMYAKEALVLAQKNKYLKGMGDAYNFMGVSYKRMGEYDKAQEFLEKALHIRKQTNDLEGLAATYSNIGEIYRNHGDYKNALEYSNEALKIDQKNKDLVGISYSLNNIGEIYTFLGNYPKALEYCLQAMKIREQLKDWQALATSQNYVGDIYLYQDNFEQALYYYQKSLKLRLQVNEKKGIGASYHAIGTVYMYQKSYDKAQEFLEKAIELRQQIKDLRGEANSFDMLAKVFFFKQKHDIAYDYFEKAFQIYQTINDTAHISLPLLGMAGVNLEKKEWLLAQQQAEKALKAAQNTSLKEAVKEAYKLLSQLHESQNNLGQSLKFYKLYVAQKDSLISEANLKLVRSLQLDYEIEKKENEIQLLNKEQALQNLHIKRQELFLWAISVVLLLVILLSYISYRAYVNGKKSNKLLREQKAEIQMRNEELYQQTEEIRSQRDFIEKQNTHLKVSSQKITDSIRYAQSIQEAVLPFEERMNQNLGDYFVIYRPKDIVAGDFYWLGKEENLLILAVIDCTGHGVPGAFMSMISYSLMNQIVHNEKNSVPSKILERLHQQIRKALRQDQKANDDGMDVAICQIDKANKRLVFAGAKLPLFYTHQKKLHEIKGTRRSLGGLHKSDKVFEDNPLSLSKNDMLYLASDGFIDQNNAQNQNFGSVRFKNTLQHYQDLPLDQQKIFLEKELDKHQQETEQRDDITLIGLRM